MEHGDITGAVTEFLRAAATDPSNIAAQQMIASAEDGNCDRLNPRLGEFTGNRGALF